MPIEQGGEEPTAADRIFLEFLDRHDATDEQALEALYARYPEQRAELRGLARNWLQMADLLDALVARSSLRERLQRRFGEDVDPGVSLDQSGGDEPGGADRTEGTPAEQGALRMAAWDGQSRRYQPRKKLAVGGMGTVYQVWDDHLRRILAMKVAHVSFQEAPASLGPESGASLLTRFLEEAQITGQLDHPGIVPVHDIGLDAKGRVFFTMRLVRGRTLKEVFDLAREGRDGWTQARVLGGILRACEAVAYAHAKGVIHRDLKPANIMVGRFGETYVMDWGLAKVLDSPDRHDLRLQPASATQTLIRTERTESSGDLDSPLITMDGLVVGTPSYMPPEQARGATEQLGPRSDVYSMGAVLYELLAGHLPFVPPGVRKSARTVLAEVIDKGPKPLHEIDRHLPAELVAICEKAMSRDPSARYADMAAMAEDLRAFLEDRVVRAYRTGAWTEFRKWVVRNRGMAAAILVAIAVALGALGTIAWVQTVARRELDRKNTELLAAHGEASRQREAAEQQRDEVLRLADLKRLADLRARAEKLWPAWPEMVDAMEQWQDEAQELAGRLQLHKATLWVLRLNSLGPGSEKDRGEEAVALDRLPAIVETVHRQPGGSLTASQNQEVAGLTASLAAAHALRDWTFPDTETQWRHDALAGLVKELEEFSGDDPRVATMASVAARVETAWNVDAMHDEYVDEWEECIESLADATRSPRYGALEIEVQTGLVPVGQDPKTGLWEFADLQSGRVPERKAGGALELDGETGLVFVLLPGGRFLMGAQFDDPDGPNYDPGAEGGEAPVNEVTLDPFFCSKYEMTQRQWERVIGSNPSYYGRGDASREDWSRYPVESVSWDECRRALVRLGLVLPTEAQWEYAARGGTDTPWPTGRDRESLKGLANLADQTFKNVSQVHREGAVCEAWSDGYAFVAPVGSFRPNNFGLHDVCGNVWEWCRDWRRTYAAPVRPGDGQSAKLDSHYHAYRGGSYEQFALMMRPSYRAKTNPEYRTFVLGLRAVRVLKR